MPEFINPRVDWAFKRIFGSDDTKECLITFLNGVFEDEFVIKDVKHLKTEQTRHQKRERGVIFDVTCETDDTKKSKAWQLSGLRYGFEKMRVVFLQLPLFEKKEPECMDIFDCWIYVLNNMEHLKEIPFLDKYPVFRKLAAIGDLQKLTPEERDYYEEDVKIMRDLYATDKWEKEKRRMEREAARKELEEATKKALTEGRAEGRAEGKAEGRAEGMLEVAKNLLSMDIPILQIMQATGLTQEQIKGLQN